MSTLFFYGTLRFQPLLECVLARPLDLIPATLRDYRVVWAEGESFPMMIPAEGELAEGVLARDLSDEDIARLDFYEGAFAYDLVDVQPEGPGGPEPARVYLPKDAPWRPGAPWSLEEWAETWGPLTLIAAAEVMRAHGRETAQQVAGRFPIIRARAQARVSAGGRYRPTSYSSGHTRSDVEILRLDRPYEKFFAVEEYEARFRRFDGQWTDTGPRAVFRVADAVTVLPYDPERDLVMLVEQLRMGPFAHGDPQPWLLEPVAGIVDAGETHESTAYREAVEEAHVELSKLYKVAGYYPSPGGIAQHLVSYVGLASLADDRKLLGGLDHEGEDIRNILVPFDQLYAMLETGELVNAPLILSVQWLALNRDRVRAGL